MSDAATGRDERTLHALEGMPIVVDWFRESPKDTTVRLRLSFRGCDDDAFEIDADLTSVKFDHEEA